MGKRPKANPARDKKRREKHAKRRSVAKKRRQGAIAQQLDDDDEAGESRWDPLSEGWIGAAMLMQVDPLQLALQKIDEHAEPLPFLFDPRSLRSEDNATLLARLGAFSATPWSEDRVIQHFGPHYNLCTCIEVELARDEWESWPGIRRDEAYFVVRELLTRLLPERPHLSDAWNIFASSKERNREATIDALIEHHRVVIAHYGPASRAACMSVNPDFDLRTSAFMPTLGSEIEGFFTDHGGSPAWIERAQITLSLLLDGAAIWDPHLAGISNGQAFVLIVKLVEQEALDLPKLIHEWRGKTPGHPLVLCLESIVCALLSDPSPVDPKQVVQALTQVDASFIEWSDSMDCLLSEELSEQAYARLGELGIAPLLEYRRLTAMQDATAARERSI